MVEPRLTTIRQNAARIGERATQLLLDVIEGRETEERMIRLDTELIEGESVRRLV